MLGGLPQNQGSSPESVGGSCSDRPAFGEVVRRLESMQLPREARTRTHAGETVLGGSE